MPTPGSDGERAYGGLGGAAKAVSERASALLRLELQLAALELKRKVAALGLGIALGVGAALFALFALIFALLGLAAVIDIWLPRWAALFVVMGALLLLAGTLGLLALKAIRRGTPPVPTQAIEEAKRTGEALKANGRS